MEIWWGNFLCVEGDGRVLAAVSDRKQTADTVACIMSWNAQVQMELQALRSGGVMQMLSHTYFFQWLEGWHRIDHNGRQCGTLSDDGHDSLIHTISNTVWEEIVSDRKDIKVYKGSKVINLITASPSQVHWYASSNLLPVPRVLSLHASS